ncbi:MAG: ribosome-associated translation inhibitor RaiA [Firmicutes bacterium]|nr:ribosome-associated translation inhibitor RaiA [Bacillota bacterium]MBQ4092315.1 ribosome-associated translation inhibitor RaiA [Bacillota bacterium]
MTINYKGKNIEVTPALKEHAEKKIGRLSRIMDIDKVTVTLIAEGNREKAEVSMMIKGYLLRGEDSGQDVFAAIDTVVDKLEKQLVKYKEKLQRKTKKDKGKIAEAAVEEVAYAEPEDELVRTKRFQVKPMTVDEAIMQMNMIGHSFFVFSNSENEEEINVVYVRNDGKYGLIVPEK